MTVFTWHAERTDVLPPLCVLGTGERTREGKRESRWRSRGRGEDWCRWPMSRKIGDEDCVIEIALINVIDLKTQKKWKLCLWTVFERKCISRWIIWYNVKNNVWDTAGAAVRMWVVMLILSWGFSMISFFILWVFVFSSVGLFSFCFLAFHFTSNLSCIDTCPICVTYYVKYWSIERIRPTVGGRGGQNGYRIYMGDGLWQESLPWKPVPGDGSCQGQPGMISNEPIWRWT